MASIKSLLFAASNEIIMIKNAVIIRYNEIAIKSRQTRRRFVDLLIKSFKKALKYYKIEDYKVRVEFGRIFIDTDEPYEVTKIVTKIFGVHSASPAFKLKTNFENILQTGLEYAIEIKHIGRKFVVRARRVGNHEFTSDDINRKLGEKILENIPDLQVSLKNPDWTIYVEIRNEDTYIFHEIFEGVGGLPTGTQGKIIATISGGLDSPVAIYKAIKRGCIPVFVHFNNGQFVDKMNLKKALESAKILASYIWTHDVKMYIVPHELDLMHALEYTHPKMICIFCRRNMYRLAERIALKENADAIITGEMIGEQASQTLRNLRVTSQAITQIPIHRPVIGDDKLDVEKVAKQIGTYEINAIPSKSCGLAPKYPIINADLKKILELESHMDIENVLRQELENISVIYLVKDGEPTNINIDDIKI